MRILVVLAPIALLVSAIVVARATSHPVDGVGCDPFEATGYHVHAFLSIVDRGRVSHPPAGVGIHYEHLCLYWLHTHDGSGIIHIEAPHRFKPRLGQFFAVWGQPLSAHQVAGIQVRSGEHIRTYVGQVRFRGDPRGMPLRNHESITIEVGPPFAPPVKGYFGGL